MHRMTILGEIVRGENFEQEQLTVVFELLMWEGKTWELEEEEGNEGDFNVTKSVTQMGIATQAIMSNGQSGCVQ